MLALMRWSMRQVRQCVAGRKTTRIAAYLAAAVLFAGTVGMASAANAQHGGGGDARAGGGGSHGGGFHGGGFHAGSGGFHGGGFQGGGFHNGGFHGGGFRAGGFREGFRGNRFHRGLYGGLAVGLGGVYAPFAYDYYSAYADYYGYPDYGDEQPYTAQYWYYCSDPAGYYPFVAQCNTGWQAVPAS